MGSSSIHILVKGYHSLENFSRLKKRAPCMNCLREQNYNPIMDKISEAPQVGESCQQCPERGIICPHVLSLGEGDFRGKNLAGHTCKLGSPHLISVENKAS